MPTGLSRHVEKIEAPLGHRYQCQVITYILTSSFFPSFLLSFFPTMPINNSDGSFYSFSVPHPSPEDFNTKYTQLAQIRAWNGNAVCVYWHESQNEIAFEINEEWIVQPDDVLISDSLARIFACETYQLRFHGLEYFSNADAYREVATSDDIWLLYEDDWRVYGRERTLLQFNVEVDTDARGESVPPGGEPLGANGPSAPPTDYTIA